ncbi:MAG: hypothetical protein ACOYM2_20315 [Rectinemataceae bacterium]
MRFSDGTAAFASLDLATAGLQGFPPGSGVYAPSEGIDIRFLAYEGELPAIEAATLTLDLLLPEGTPVGAAADLARSVLAHGSGNQHGSLADRLSLSLAGFLCPAVSEAASEGRPVCLVSLEGEALRSLAEACMSYGLPLVALCPEAGITGLLPGLLARAGGSVFAIGVKGGKEAILLLEHGAGAESGPFRFLPLGSGSPLRFIGKLVHLIVRFLEERRGFQGELYLSAPDRDEETLAVALWAWSWGLPLTGILVPEEMPAPSPGSGHAAALLARFVEAHPHASLLIRPDCGDFRSGLEGHGKLFLLDSRSLASGDGEGIAAHGGLDRGSGAPGAGVTLPPDAMVEPGPGKLGVVMESIAQKWLRAPPGTL